MLNVDENVNINRFERPESQAMYDSKMQFLVKVKLYRAVALQELSLRAMH